MVVKKMSLAILVSVLFHRPEPPKVGPTIQFGRYVTPTFRVFHICVNDVRGNVHGKIIIFS